MILTHSLTNHLFSILYMRRQRLIRLHVKSELTAQPAFIPKASASCTRLAVTAFYSQRFWLRITLYHRDKCKENIHCLANLYLEQEGDDEDEDVDENENRMQKDERKKWVQSLWLQISIRLLCALCLDLFWTIPRYSSDLPRI